MKSDILFEVVDSMLKLSWGVFVLDTEVDVESKKVDGSQRWVYFWEEIMVGFIVEVDEIFVDGHMCKIFATLGIKLN